MDEILTEKCEEIFAKMPELFDMEDAMRRFPLVKEESMNTVLI